MTAHVRDLKTEPVVGRYYLVDVLTTRPCPECAERAALVTEGGDRNG